MHTDEITEFAEYYAGIKTNYCGTYPCDELAKFETCIETAGRMDKVSLPSIIMNTDPSTKPGDHWVSLVKLHDERSFFLFDSYGAVGFHRLFERNQDERVLRKFLRGLEKVSPAKRGPEMENLTLYKLMFIPNRYENTDTSNLSPVMRGLCNLLYTYHKKYKIPEFNLIWYQRSTTNIQQ